MKSIDSILVRMQAIALAGLFLAPCGNAVAQIEFSRTTSRAEIVFFFDAISVISEQPGKSRIDIYIQVPYRELHFLKIGEEYLAKYEATVQMLDKDKQTVAQSGWNNEVNVKEFGQTSSDKLFSLAHKLLDIPPGTYEIDVEVYEPETQRRTTQKKSILVTDFGRDELSFSDIMLVNKITQIGDKTAITPNVSGTFLRQSSGFYLFFEAYHVSPIDSLFLVSHIFDAQKKEVWSKQEAEPPTESKMQVFVKVDSINFPAGMYMAVIEGYNARAGSNPELKATTSRTFAVRWPDMPLSITNIDKGIDEMRYVAKEIELDSIRAGKTVEERRRRFLEFWNKRNPDPSSGRNPLMEEYYRRVDYANKAFTRYMEGWKTDMGMVYIRLGPPDNIERHPFEMGSKPYEIWYYYELNRECVFVDYSGFGDYRLQNPTADLFRGLR